jgi:hypothetical protein
MREQRIANGENETISYFPDLQPTPYYPDNRQMLYD